MKLFVGHQIPGMLTTVSDKGGGDSKMESGNHFNILGITYNPNE